MKMIIEGVMENNLPWGLVFAGVFIAVVVEIVGIPVLPFAIGIYLPVQLNACIMAGGIVRLFFNRIGKNREEGEKIIGNGVLYCSGMIAGEGLVGIVLAVLAVFGLEKYIDISDKLGITDTLLSIGSVAIFVLIILSVAVFANMGKRKLVRK